MKHTFLFKALIATLLMGFAVSCSSSDDDPVIKIGLSTEKVTFGAVNPQDQTVTVTSEETWTPTSQETWFTFEKENDNTLRISTDSNPRERERTGKITITTASNVAYIEIVQEVGGQYLTLLTSDDEETESIIIPANLDKEMTFTVKTSEDSWNASTKDNWFKVKRETDNTFTISADPNKGEARKGTLTITAGELTKDYPVVQRTASTTLKTFEQLLNSHFEAISPNGRYAVGSNRANTKGYIYDIELDTFTEIFPPADVIYRNKQSPFIQVKNITNEGVVCAQIRTPKYTFVHPKEKEDEVEQVSNILTGAVYKNGEWITLDISTKEPFLDQHDTPNVFISNGDYVIGRIRKEDKNSSACKWNANTGEIVEIFASDVKTANPLDSSEDGSIMVGWATGPSGNTNPALWMNGVFQMFDGIMVIGDALHQITPDGKYAVGRFAGKPILWTSSQPGELPVLDVSSNPEISEGISTLTKISDDANLIAGSLSKKIGGDVVPYAYMVENKKDVHVFYNFLTEVYGYEFPEDFYTSKYPLEDVVNVATITGISGDGKTIIGRFEYTYEAFMIRLGERSE